MTPLAALSLLAPLINSDLAEAAQLNATPFASDREIVLKLLVI